ncbi:protein ABHD13-like [Sycon ciliatum]|uniref:protein ABHD13-like n=1 Tax=Sycon ciliatum TaxID=27933 RepID=UPI0031F640D8
MKEYCALACISGSRNTQSTSYRCAAMIRQSLYRLRSTQAVLKVILTRCWKSCSAACLVLFLLYWVYGGAAMLTLLSVALLGAFYHYQDSFLYLPETPERSRLFVQTPMAFSLPYENIYLRTEDGVRIHAYFIKQPPGMLQTVPTILFLHGNAGNIGHRLPNAQALYVECQCNILLLEYRGFGRSDGAPSEAGLFLDSKAGMDVLLSRSDIDIRKIIVFGRSLGGAVAAKLCSHPAYVDRACAVLIENSFSSIPMLAKVLFHPLAGRLPEWAFKNQFFSVNSVRLIRAPTLFLSGLDDQLVPAWMMEQLFQNCGAPAKHVQRFPQGGHNNTWQCRGYYNTWRAFLSQVALVNSFSIRPYTEYEHQVGQVIESFEQTDDQPPSHLRSSSASSLHEPILEHSLTSSTSSLASLASNGPATTHHGYSIQTTSSNSAPTSVRKASAPSRKNSRSSSNPPSIGNCDVPTLPVTGGGGLSGSPAAPLAEQVHQYQSNWGARETGGIVVNESALDCGPMSIRQSANLTDVWSV